MLSKLKDNTIPAFFGIFINLLQKSAICDIWIYKARILLTITFRPAIIKAANGIFIPFSSKGGS